MLQVGWVMKWRFQMNCCNGDCNQGRDCPAHPDAFIGILMFGGYVALMLAAFIWGVLM